MKVIVCIAIGVLCCFACKKNDSRPNTPTTPKDSTINVKKTYKDSVYIYDSLIFSAITANNKFFSTFDTSFKSPTSLTNLTASQIRNIDIVFAYDYYRDYPCFLDPTFSSTNPIPAEGDIYGNPALDSSIKTSYYRTYMDIHDFDSVTVHPYLFNEYFKDLTKVTAPYWPDGAIVGNPFYNFALSKGMVLGFTNDKSGKRGFMFIRYDQDHGWPSFPETGFRTHVDIVKEK